MSRFLKGLFWGSIVGALLACPDGALFGFILAWYFEEEAWLLALRWASFFALGGALVGAFGGCLWQVWLHRLRLPPPES